MEIPRTCTTSTSWKWLRSASSVSFSITGHGRRTTVVWHPPSVVRNLAENSRHRSGSRARTVSRCRRPQPASVGKYTRHSAQTKRPASPMECPALLSGNYTEGHELRVQGSWLDSTAVLRIPQRRMGQVQTAQDASNASIRNLHGSAAPSRSIGLARWAMSDLIPTAASSLIRPAGPCGYPWPRAGHARRETLLRPA
jgi:hypothetical protein